MTAPEVQIRRAGSLAWGPDLRAEERAAGPEPGTGGFAAPGFSAPARRHLVPSCAAAGLAARVVGPGDDIALALRLNPTGSEVIPLATPPRGVVAREDGVWALSADGLTAADRTGHTVMEVDARGTRLLGTGSTAGSAWVIDSEAASFVTPDGSVRRFTTPWRDPSGPVTFGDALVGWHPDATHQLRALTPDGSLQPQPAGFERRDFERLVAYDGHTALVSTLRSLHRRGADDDSLELLGCGGASDDGVFAAIRTAGASWLCLPAGVILPIEVSPGERVLAVRDDRVLVASRKHARWIGPADDGIGDTLERFVLDDNSYTRQTHPVAWEMPTSNAHAALSPRHIVVTSSGPSGMVAVALEWALN